MSGETQDPLVDRARAQVGRTLKDKYRLDGLLGVGGMASVFSATHRNGNRVAVKLLHPELMLNKEALGRFLREGYAANKVEHSGTVRVLDDDNDDGVAFLVMELLDGETVDALWERSGHALDARRVLHIADQVLDVLAAAHDKGIVHRDIKPENLFLTKDGALKILDFGIARMRESTAGVTATRTGSAFGSPAFMAPEQAQGRARDVDARSDLYAVGATMFTLLSGQHVHEAESAHEMMIVAATIPARSLASVRTGVPPQVTELVDRTLAFDGRSRWPDARAMQRAVRETHASLDGGALPAFDLGGGFALPPEPNGSHPRFASEVSATAPTAIVAIPEAKESAARPTSPLVLTAPPTSTGAAWLRPKRRLWPLAASVGSLALVVGVVATRMRAPQAPPTAPSAGAATAEQHGVAPSATPYPASSPSVADVPSPAAPPTGAPTAPEAVSSAAPAGSVSHSRTRKSAAPSAPSATKPMPPSSEPASPAPAPAPSDNPFDRR
jgi:serine/threonine protein kinase